MFVVNFWNRWEKTENTKLSQGGYLIITANCFLASFFVCLVRQIREIWIWRRFSTSWKRHLEEVKTN